MTETIEEDIYRSKIEKPILKLFNDKRFAGKLNTVIFTKGIPIRVIRKKKPEKVSLTWMLLNSKPSADRLRIPRVVFYLCGWNIDDVKRMIDRSVKAMGTSPKGTFYFLHGKGRRSVRKIQIPNVKLLLSNRGYKVEESKETQLKNKKDVMAYFTGSTHVNFKENTLLPGAIGDHLTSYGGRLYAKDEEPSFFDSLFGRGKVKKVQMSILDYIRHGASGSYGNLEEPTNHLSRHSNLNIASLYTEGFTIGESYTKAVANPVFGIFVGDPLTSPYGTFAICKQTKDRIEIHRSKKSQIKEVHLWDQGHYVKPLFIKNLSPDEFVSISFGKNKWTFKAKQNETLSSFLERIRKESQKLNDFPIYFQVKEHSLLASMKIRVERPLAFKIKVDGDLILENQLKDRLKLNMRFSSAVLIYSGKKTKGEWLKVKCGANELIVQSENSNADWNKVIADKVNAYDPFRNKIRAIAASKNRIVFISKREGFFGNGLSIEFDSGTVSTNQLTYFAQSQGKPIYSEKEGQLKLVLQGATTGASFKLKGLDIYKINHSLLKGLKAPGVSVLMNDQSESAKYFPIKNN